MTPIAWEVFVDWDMTDWSAVPDFAQAEDDISADVETVGVIRGKDTEAGNIPAGTFEIRLRNDLALALKYSPVNASSPLVGRLKPWRRVRIRALYNGVYYPVFAGFIAKYHLKVNAKTLDTSVILYCTDGIDLLARQQITEDWDNRVDLSEGEAVGAILDAAGWGANRVLDAGPTINYPTVAE
jgi:hypothetical protein